MGGLGKMSFAFRFAALAAMLWGPPGEVRSQETTATVAEMAESREDVWGEAAIRRPEGPSFEFFRDLLPPLKYVNTDFRHYPIVLSAPQAPVKARWISNGSGVNLRADKPPMWKEAGTPVQFFVGDPPAPFGGDMMRLGGPRYDDGYLPIVQIEFEHDGAWYRQEAFASVRGEGAERGAVYVRFDVLRKPGRVTARLPNDSHFLGQEGAIDNDRRERVILFGPAWRWNEAARELTAELEPEAPADLVVFTKAAARSGDSPIRYEQERAACLETWKEILARGTQLSIAEPVVHQAWQALVIGNHLIADGDRMNYSAGNAYDHLYEGECGDAVRSLLHFGHAETARSMVQPLLEFDRKATRFHVAGHKLQLLNDYYWITRDAEYLREKRPLWASVVQFIRDSRKTQNGLLPKDNFAGDVSTQIYSLNSNANCWRGLRDLAAVLEEAEDQATAAELRAEAAEFREAILRAVTESQDNNARFIPVSLLGDETPHDPLTATRTGSYHNLMIPYVLGSRIFGPGDDREAWIIDYLRQRGGLAMGMIRSMPHQGEFNEQPGVNVLYGLRYNLCLLRRGDRDHALGAFYGQLAQAMTRDTFIGGEGSRFLHGDQFGRSFYLPPNSASNAAFLTTLRYLLVQDWDMDDDGRPETLRLCDAIPPRWLQEGSPLVVRNAPSAFGPLSFRIESQMTEGVITAELEAPPRPPGKWRLRLPDPPGYAIKTVRIGGREFARDNNGRVDLTGQKGSVSVRFEVSPQLK